MTIIIMDAHLALAKLAGIERRAAKLGG